MERQTQKQLDRQIERQIERQKVAIIQSNKLFQAFLKPTLSFIAWWSIFRIVLMLSVQDKIVEESAAILIQSVFVGFRFDLLCWGFMWIPVVLALSVLALLGWIPLVTSKILKIYFSVFWLLSILIHAFDFIKFSTQFKRAVWLDYSSPQNFLAKFINENGTVYLTSVLFVLFVVFLFQWLIVRRSDIRAILPAELRASKAELFGRLIGPILFVGLAARGTISAQHLRKEHSDVSTNVVLNQLVLSPLWTLDK